MTIMAMGRCKWQWPRDEGRRNNHIYLSLAQTMLSMSMRTDERCCILSGLY